MATRLTTSDFEAFHKLFRTPCSQVEFIGAYIDQQTGLHLNVVLEYMDVGSLEGPQSDVHPA